MMFLDFKLNIINNTLSWVRHNYYLHLLHKENTGISTFLNEVQYCVIQESLALHYFQFQLSLAQIRQPFPSLELFLSMWEAEWAMKIQAAVSLGSWVMWANARWVPQTHLSELDPDPQALGSTLPSAFIPWTLLAELGNFYLELPYPWRAVKTTSQLSWSDGDCVSRCVIPLSARRAANTGASRKSTGSCPRAFVPNSRTRPKANPATLSHWDFLCFINQLVLIAYCVFTRT